MVATAPRRLVWSWLRAYDMRLVETAVGAMNEAAVVARQLR